MNIFNRVTLQSLKKNRVRTIVTIIGIILSTAMICAVTTFISSIYNYVYDNAVYMYGDWHGSVLNADLAMYEEIESDSEVKNVVYGQQLGYAYAEGCANDYKPYIYLLGVSEGFEDTMPIHITSGTYPTKLGEILLPNHLATNGKVRYKLGDEITLELGERISDGERLGQNTPLLYYIEEPETKDDEESVYEERVVSLEEIKVKEKKIYKVAGFYERPGFEAITAPGYTAITVMDETSPISKLYDVYFKMKDARDYYEYVKSNGLSAIRNETVLQYSGVTGYDTLDGMVYGFIVIIVGLIMFGSVALIYNAFSISVSERTKQFGLLASVGATKKQLRRMVIYEAMIVSLVGIPVGIISGIGGIGVTLLIIGNRFTSFMNYSLPMRVHVSPLAVVLAAVIALVTVLISAWIPSKRATKVSAVEAIRQNVDINVKSKKIKTSRFVYKVFGLPGTLASKYYKRSRKKYRATVASLFMSIVLFIVTSSFTQYMIEMVNISLGSNTYDISYNLHDEDDASKEEILRILSDANAVTDVAYIWSTVEHGWFDVNDVTEDGKSYLADMGYDKENEEYAKKGKSTVTMIKTFVQDEAFEKLLEKHHLNKALYMNSDKPLGIAVDGVSDFDYKKEKYVTFNYLENKTPKIMIEVQKPMEGYTGYGITVDDEGNRVWSYGPVGAEQDESVMVYIPYDEGRNEIDLQIGTTIYERPYYVVESNVLQLLYPESAAKAICGDSVSSFSYFFVKSHNHSISFKDIKNTLQEKGLDTKFLDDYAADAEENRNIILIIQVFCYGFIVLISLIAAANVFNTISTNISLRRREFATLKSVGMTAKGFNKMMNYECLLYGTKALLYGMPVALILSFLIWRVATSGYGFGYIVPWSAIGIAVLSVFLVVFVTMMYSMSKIKKENPIDALKNENL